MNKHIFFFMLALLLTVFLIHVLRKPAQRIGLIDAPGGRKKHFGVIPLIGGIAIFFAFLFAAMGMGVLGFARYGFIAAMGLLVFVGALDDLHDLSPRNKFIAQIVAAVFMTSWAGLHVSQLGDLLGFGGVNLHDWAIPFTIICVLGVINAINMTDGMDGLAGGLVLIVLFWFAVVAIVTGLNAQFDLLMLLIAALLGFLAFNMRHRWRERASVFMGDAGSMMLGLVLVWFSVDLTQGEGRELPPMAAVWILAFPLLDMGSVMLRRIVKRQSPFAADRRHMHHILLLAGYSEKQVVQMLLLLSALLGGMGVFMWRAGVPEYVMFYGFTLLFLAYYYGLTNAWRLMKVIKRFRNAS